VSRHYINSHGDTLWITFEGTFCASDVENFLVDLRQATSKWNAYKFFVCDVSSVSRTSSDIHRASQEVLTYLRGLGVEWMVVVAPAAILSMIIRTTAFVARLQVRAVDDIASAKREVERLRPSLMPPPAEPKSLRPANTNWR
jgi:hypothetical protein